MSRGGASHCDPLGHRRVGCRRRCQAGAGTHGVPVSVVAAGEHVHRDLWLRMSRT